MEWKKIEAAWNGGERDIAVRLVRAMIYEMRFTQRSLKQFGGR